MRSDHQALCGSFVTYFTDFSRTLYGAHDSTRGTGIPAQSTTLLASPSGCMGATVTASTSVVTVSEGFIVAPSVNPHPMTTRAK
jgi:hypothetical protein